ncbi:serine hydrolase domain-containing protein [Maritalea sp. S77]|uniref:serine hydrolase domain-containing protein n=1 Tax=Maritalea sp. S77 TaxID=3415125 RepID=UPI003C7E6840
MRTIDNLVEQYMANGTFPCGEVLLARGSDILMHKAYGFMEGSDIALLKKGALFDLASLTKPLATAQLLVKLVREGKLDLDDLVRAHLPELMAARQHEMTIRQLALHQAGFPPDSPFAKKAESAEQAWREIHNIKLQYQPGTDVVYSCLGYLLLGQIIERVTRFPLDEAFDEMIAKPLGLKHTLFAPLSVARQLPTIVPTVPAIRPAGYIRGMVNDSTARVLGGKVGNAGLFSSAPELHKMALNLLENADPLIFENGNPNGLTPRTIGFEYNDQNQLGCSCGEHFAHGAVGHTGFTGTSLWIDPSSGLIVIALTNRVYLSYRDTIDSMRQFRAKLHTIAQKI